MSRTESTSASASRSEFEVTAGEQTTRGERYRHWVDTHLLAPARIVWTDWRARVGVLVVLGYVLMGLVAWVSASNWWILNGITLVARPAPNQGPALIGAFRTLQHPLGTTYLGTDILSQLVYATPFMLKMIVAGAVFTVIVATVIGTVAGYKGGIVDTVLMTLSDIAMTIPGLVLVIVLASALELDGNPYVIGVLLSVNAWAGLARSIRSQVLTLRDAAYVEASRIMGVPTGEIIRSDIVPNVMPYITMNFVQQARNVIFFSVALYLLGVLPYTGANWGVMMNAAYQQAGAVSSPQAFHWLLVPMLAIISLSLGLTLIAQGADRLFNPRVRARHAKSIASDDDANTTGDI